MCNSDTSIICPPSSIVYIQRLSLLLIPVLPVIQDSYDDKFTFNRGYAFFIQTYLLGFQKSLSE